MSNKDNNIVISNSDGNVVIQGSGSNSTCIINGKKYVNGKPVEYNQKEALADEIRAIETTISKFKNKIENLELKLKRKKGHYESCT